MDAGAQFGMCSAWCARPSRACISLSACRSAGGWLNSRLPATEVACRAGHGVAVLLKIYAHCIDGRAAPATGASPTPSAPRTLSKALVTREMGTEGKHPEIAGLWL